MDGRTYQSQNVPSLCASRAPKADVDCALGVVSGNALKRFRIASPGNRIGLPPV